MKYIFVTGGVVSSLGKGLTGRRPRRAARAARPARPHPEIRPYLNVDPGTMSPFQHGESNVLEDGRRDRSSTSATMSGFTSGKLSKLNASPPAGL